MPLMGNSDYQGLDAEFVLARQGQSRQAMGLEAFWRCFMTFWVIEQEGLCHDHAQGMTPDLLRVLYHGPALVHSDKPLVFLATVSTPVGWYHDAEFIWLDRGEWN